MKISIRSLLTFGFTGLLALSITAVVATGIMGAFGNTLALLTQESVQMLREAERRLSNELDPIEAQTRYLSSRFEAGDLSFDRPGELSLALESSLAGLPGLAGLVVLPVDGDVFDVGLQFQEDGGVNVVSGRAKPSPLLLSALENARQLKEGTWLPPVWVPSIGTTLINYHQPLYYEGELKGLLIIGKTIGQLSEGLKTIQVGGEKVPFLLYDQVFVLAHPDINSGDPVGAFNEPLLPYTDFPDPVLGQFGELDPLPLSRFAESANIQFGNVRVDERDYFFTYRDSVGIGADKPVTVGIYIDEMRYDPFRHRLWTMFIVGLAVLALAVLITLMVSRATIRPIRDLAKASERIAAGDLENVPDVQPSFLKELDEGRLAFDGMVADLRERQRMRDLFGRFMPRSVAEILLREPEGLKPQQVIGTVLFTDLAGFTHLTEQMTPDAVVSMLNAYFTDMVNVIDAHGGIVTQFQGDAILAVFNVPIADPQHALQAVTAAREMQATLESRLYEGQRLSQRIGIATGPFVAANVGADTRMNYTVHGDTVNLAARLEAWNKQSGTRTLVAESTVTLLGTDTLLALGLKELGSVSVPGRDAPVTIFSPNAVFKPASEPAE